MHLLFLVPPSLMFSATLFFFFCGFLIAAVGEGPSMSDLSFVILRTILATEELTPCTISPTVLVL